MKFIAYWNLSVWDRTWIKCSKKQIWIRLPSGLLRLLKFLNQFHTNRHITESKGKTLGRTNIQPCLIFLFYYKLKNNFNQSVTQRDLFSSHNNWYSGNSGWKGVKKCNNFIRAIRQCMQLFAQSTPKFWKVIIARYELEIKHCLILKINQFNFAQIIVGTLSSLASKGYGIQVAVLLKIAPSKKLSKLLCEANGCLTFLNIEVGNLAVAFSNFPVTNCC